MGVTYTIERVLREHPETRSSDKTLILRVWEMYGFGLSEAQKEIFMKLPQAETIRRVRQKLQEQGKYQANDQVKRQRNWKSMVAQQRMPTTKPDKLPQVFGDEIYERVKNG